MVVDILFLLGCVITWYGYTWQVVKLIGVKSTRSFSLNWLAASSISIAVVLPRAFTSGLWVWWFGSTVSFIYSALIIVLFLFFRRKYPNQ